MEDAQAQQQNTCSMWIGEIQIEIFAGERCGLRECQYGSVDDMDSLLVDSAATREYVLVKTELSHTLKLLLTTPGKGLIFCVSELHRDNTGLQTVLDHCSGSDVWDVL